MRGYVGVSVGETYGMSMHHSVNCIILNKVSVNWSTKKKLTLLVVELTLTAAIEEPFRLMQPIGVPKSKLEESPASSEMRLASLE
jgi:hypothetical protein